MISDGLIVSQLIQALGWALVHSLWQGALVGLLFAAGNALLRDAAPAWRYGFGLAALAALAVLPVATFLLALPQAAALAAPASGLLALPVLTAGDSAAVTSQFDFARLVEQVLPWVVAAWIAGVVLHSLRVYINWQRMRRLTRVGVRAVPAALLERTVQLRRVLGITRAVSVLESTRVKVPTVLGWFKPVILLPTATLVGLTPRQIELVIAHELGHVRRWDYLVNLAQVCIETALFYHPVVGWISRRVREEREKCCDDLVVTHCGHHLEYAKALHNLESIRSGSIAPALAATDGKLFERIERIVQDRSAEPREAIAGNTLFLVILGAALVLAGRLADPMANLELRRAALADSLVNELLIATVPRHSQALLAPLENARVRIDDPVPSPVLEVPPVVVSAPADTGAGTTVSERPGRPQQAEPVARRSSAPTGEPAGTSIDLGEAVAPPPAAARRSPISAVQVAATHLTDAPEPEPAQPAVSKPAGPVALTRRAPEYPVRARMAGQTGFVVLSFAIGADGRPMEIEIEESHPRRVFEKSSLRAIKGWRFDRSTLGTASERVTQRFDFNLHQSSPLVDGAGRECRPITGTRICRTDSPTFLKAREAASH